MYKTKNGIMFVLIGLILLVFPLVGLFLFGIFPWIILFASILFGFFSPIFLLMGIIYFYIGRKEFGRLHQINVNFALNFVFLYFILFVILLYFGEIYETNIRLWLFTDNVIVTYESALFVVESLILMIALLIFVKQFVKREIYKFIVFALAIYFLFSLIYPWAVYTFYITFTALYYAAYKEIKKYEGYFDSKGKIQFAQKIPVEKKEEVGRAFNYYCLGCLHQTNDDSSNCPKCGGLLKEVKS